MQNGLRVHWRCLIVKSKQKPQIQFPDFKDGWQNYKLGEVYTERKEKGKDSLPILSVSIHKGVSDEELDTDALGKSVLRSEDKSLYKHVFPGDLVLNMMRAWQGAFGVVKLEGMVSPAYITAIPSNQIFPLFMDYCLHRDEMIAQINNLSYGVTDFRKRLYWKSFINVSCHIPSVSEQKKVTSFFTKLDKSISIHQQELTTLKQTKRGFLQKMFPKEGTSLPEIRFSGFSGPWEQHKLGQVANITMGQSPNGENYTENPNDYILVQGNADIKNGWVAPRVWTTQVTKSADKGDIILSVRAPVGDVGKTQFDVVLGRGVAGIKGNEFIFQSLCKMKSNGFWTKYSTGSTFESINSNDLKEAIISVPGELEQIKIGEFFKQLDETITLHQRELDSLKKTRIAFLQKMFA